MSYTKKAVKTRETSKVRFAISSLQVDDSKDLFLVGSFNNWDDPGMAMKKGKNGIFSCELELNNGEKYLFRYRNSEGVWFNDPDAEAYEPCPYAGASNCVLWV